MKRNVFVMSSDSLMRNNMRFTVEALHGGLRDSWRNGLPLLISHDFTRFTGWNWPIGLHMEPGLTRLLGLTELPESSDELNELFDRFIASQQARLDKGIGEALPKLRTLLSTSMDGSETPVDLAAAAFVGPGLARRTFPELFESEDKDGLVALDPDFVTKLRPVLPGVYKVGDLLVFAHHYFRRSLSWANNLNAELLSALEDLASHPDVTVRLHLDPDAVGLAGTEKPAVELAYWYGPPFQPDLTSIPPGVTAYTTDEQQRFYSGITRTDFWWQARVENSGRTQHILEAEELRDEPIRDHEGETYACRYIHSIVQDDGAIQHLDGAVRQYPEAQMVERLDLSIATAGRKTRYTKLWRVDGKLPLERWKALIYHHYRDNPLVGEYFGVAAPTLADKGDDNTSELAPEPIVRRLVPHGLRPGSGVRLAFSYKQGVTAPAGYTRWVMPTHSLSSALGQQKVIDADTVELRKLLHRAGEQLSIPADAKRLSFKDLYQCFPLVLHSTPEAARKTVDAMLQLIESWRRRKNDRVVIFNIGVPIGEVQACISILGHIDDLEQWFKRAEPIPLRSTEKLALGCRKLQPRLRPAVQARACPRRCP